MVFPGNYFFDPPLDLLEIPHFRQALSEHISCQFRFPALHSGNSSLFQCTISGNACYREIFIVTVSELQEQKVGSEILVYIESL
jgi:hypothetical protein